jgi:hypothetical protein
MNLIFKIVEHLEETEQIIVKFCRQSSPKPIDEYIPVAIDCCNINMGDYNKFVTSIMRYGVDVIQKQEAAEPILEENQPSEIIEEANIETHLNRIISISSDQLMSMSNRINKIKLD